MYSYNSPVVEIVCFAEEDVLVCSMGDNDVTMGPEN